MKNGRINGSNGIDEVVDGSSKVSRLEGGGQESTYLYGNLRYFSS